MAVHVPPADVCKISIRGVFNDGHSNWANVFHVLAAGMDESSDSQRGDLLGDIENVFAETSFYANSLGDYGSTELQIDASDGTDIFSTVFASSTLIGSDTGSPAPASACLVVSWKGSWHYRGGKPRTYRSGFGAGHMDDPQTWESSFVTSQQTSAVDVIEGIAALSGTYGSAVSLGVLLGNNATAAGTFAPFTGAVCDQGIKSQRRRLIEH